jgi:uncharacterized protein
MPVVYLADVEAAINWWRGRAPAGAHSKLSPAVNALADVYGTMIALGAQYFDENELSLEAIDAFEQWAATLPDSPCIAICSTSVGDAFCSGCGRSFDEVTRWTGMSLLEKRAVWRRTTREGTWLRFSARYADRLIEAQGTG